MRYLLHHNVLPALALALMLAGITACYDQIEEPDIPTIPTPADEPELVQPKLVHARIILPEGISVDANAAGAVTTRADIDGFVGKFAWSEGDKIAVHMSNGAYVETEVDPETGAFASSSTASVYRDCYAVYPAAVADPMHYGYQTLNVELPEEYDISGDLSSDYSPVPMIARNNENYSDLYFRHVGALIRITCDYVPEGTQKIAVTVDRNIAGTFEVTDLGTDHPSISTGGSSPTVTFRVAETALAERTHGIVLNLPVPVGRISNMSIAAINADGERINTMGYQVFFRLYRYNGLKISVDLASISRESMQMVVTAGDDTAWEFTMPFVPMATLPADLRILWGDGSFCDIPAGSRVGDFAERFKHTYAEPGDYLITLEALSYTTDPDRCYIPEFRFRHIGSHTLNDDWVDSRKMLKALPTPLLKMAYSAISTERSTAGAELFADCRHLESLCPALFSMNPQLVSFTNAFTNCSSLHQVPDDLFAYNPDVTTFFLTFAGSGLQGELPAGLFYYNEKVKSFERTFQNCPNISAIPQNLFYKCRKVESFKQTFEGCSGLTAVPSVLFAEQPDVDSFQGVFSGCSGLDGTIPSDLFAHNLKVTDFSYVFAGCTQLDGLSPGLFANHKMVKTFFMAYDGCNGLDGAIPEDLFSGCEAVESFDWLFSGCYRLDGPVPERLFASCGEATSFFHAFLGCTTLKGPIPEGLFANNKKVKVFSGVFWNCEFLDGSIPAGLFSENTQAETFARCFSGCEKLTGDIPAGLFASNSAAVNFTYAFSGCELLRATPDIFTDQEHTPSNRFASVGSSVDFTNCFAGIGYRLTSTATAGVAPALWVFAFPAAYPPVTTGCFSAPRLENYEAIPAKWK